MNARETCLVAVASTDGRVINQHFGHAERFLIYKVDGKQVEFMEERPVTKYCLGIDTHAHSFEEDRFMQVVNVIKDCRFVLTSKIGPTPQERLKHLGILPIMIYDYIEDGIRKVLDKEVSGEDVTNS